MGDSTFIEYLGQGLCSLSSQLPTLWEEAGGYISQMRKLDSAL